MILRSFRMHGEYVENDKTIEEIMRKNGCTYEKAVEIDYNQNWREKLSLFNYQTRCILSLYTRFFPKYRTDDCKILIFYCTNKVIDNVVSSCDGFCYVYFNYDFEEFFKLSEDDKKKESLELLKRGLDIVIPEKLWDKDVFYEAYNKVKEVDYINEWYWKKRLMSPKKEYKASVFCQHEVNFFYVSIIIMTKKGEEIKRKQILKLNPHELNFQIYLGKLEWIDNQTVMLSNEFGTKHWTVKLD